MRTLFNIIVLILLINPAINSRCISEKTVTISAQKEPLVDCLEKITSQTNITFVYSNNIVVPCLISCNFRDCAVEEVLTDILSQCGLEFQFTANEQIVIFKPVNNSVLIEGIVLDKITREPLPYTLVTIYGTNYGDITNEIGHFQITHQLSKSISISIQRIGYIKKIIQIDKTENRNINLSIELEEASIRFDPVIINAEDYDIFDIQKEAGKITISKQNFSILPVLGSPDISRSLQQISGISTSSFGNSGMNIRGGMPSQNLILLDGIEMYHMNHSFGFLNSFNPEAVKDVQVYKGGFPAKYGARVSGVVEYTIKNGSMSNFSLSTGFNQMGWQATGEAPLAGMGSIIVSARSSFSDFILGDLYDRVFNSFKRNIALYESNLQQPNGENEKKEISFNDILGKITFLPGKKDVISFSYFSGRDIAKTEGSTKELNVKFNENSGTYNMGFGCRWFKQWDHNFFSTIVLSGSKYKTNNSKLWDNKIPADTVFINTLVTKNELEDFTAKAEFTWDIDSDHKIESGLLYSLLITSYNFLMEYIPQYDTRINTNNQKTNIYLHTLYLQDTWKITRKLTTISGIRINKLKSLRSIDLEPRLSVNYQFSEDLLMKGCFGKYYQYLMQYDDFSNLLQSRISWITANGSNIKPLTAEHYIVGLKYEKNSFLFDFEVYYKKLYNVLETLHEWRISERNYDTFIGIQNNAESAGADLTLKKNIGTFNTWFSYSYCRSTSYYYYNGGLKNCPSSTDSPHKINIAANYSAGNFTFSAVWYYISGRPYTIPQVMDLYQDGSIIYFSDPGEYNTHRYPGAHQLDLSAAYSFSYSFINASAGISVFNIYDKKNIWYRFINLRNGKVINTDVYMLGITPTFFLDLKI